MGYIVAACSMLNKSSILASYDYSLCPGLYMCIFTGNTTELLLMRLTSDLK
jgi:hypothetical protein